MLRDKVRAELQFILTGQENYLTVIKNVNDYFLTLITPKNLNAGDKNNEVIRFQVQFAELCAALQGQGLPDPESMTVFKFYSAMKFFESKNKPKPQPHAQ